MLKPSERSDVPMFRALDMMRQVNDCTAQGIDIARMGAGQPSFGAPQAALDYAIECIQKDPRQGYTEAIGMLSLRERIAQYYSDYYGVHNINPDHIIITTGSSSAFILAFIAAFDAGDKVVLTTPTYPAYRNILKALDIEVIEIESRAEDHYQPTLDLLNTIDGDIDGLIINSPSNPAGTMIASDTLSDIAQWCDEKNIRLISDEAYHGITYETQACTARQFSEKAVITNTFSKYFAMTGWRLGWALVPEYLADRIKKLSENLFVSAPTLSQHLAAKIFDHTDDLNGYVTRYQTNRDILNNALPKAGIHNFTNATGAFYVYANISDFSNNSEEFCKRMLHEAHVATTPGTDFDLTRGHQSIRICYADSTEIIEKACTRLTKWLQEAQ